LYDAPTKTSGAVDFSKVELGGIVPQSTPIASAKSAPTKTAAPSMNEQRAAFALWATTMLAAVGVGCPQWLQMNAESRRATVASVFYGPRPAQAGVDQSPMWSLLPRNPDEVVSFIDDLCGIPRAVAVVGIGSSSPLSDWAREAWVAMVGVGLTCDQWTNASDASRWQMLQSMWTRGFVRQRRESRASLLEALFAECVNRADRPTASPTAAVMNRVRAIADCGSLAAQDKIQQIQLIQRAFPEFNRDARSVYRLALARYDLCNPSPQSGWTGGSSPAPIPERQLQRMNATGWDDPLLGDARGLSGVQWVRQGGYMPTGGPDLFDAVQGMTGDCYLIAALASIAWTMPQFLASMGRIAGDGRRSYNFGGEDVAVSERVATVMLNGFQPLFARGIRLDAQWAGVIEKAYAVWRLRDTTDRPRVNDIAGSSGGAPTGLRTYGPSVSSRWTQASPIADLIGGREFWYTTQNHMPDAMFETMQGFCTTDGRIQSPTVVCSRPDGTSVDGTGFVPSHVYSLLGIGTRPDGRRFYALRNPWGFVPEVAAPYQFQLPSRFLGRLNLNTGEGGCFAVAHDVFSSAFDLVLGSTSTRYP
jgi:hypothetical protein